MYNKETFTWGFEVEWGDINRNLVIPNHLGEWEYAETDILNLREPYKNIACDPQGVEPPVGGEINTRPTSTWQKQVQIIQELKEFFIENDCEPTACCTAHGHVHVRVPGLTEDIESLKKLVSYIKRNQAMVVDRCGMYVDTPDIKKAKGSKMYMKYDGGRLMPDYMCENIINLATDFEHFIKLHAAGKDGISMGRPFRYAINTYCLKHTGTIEFRCFRASTDTNKIADQFRFVEMFIDAALNDGPDVEDIFMENDFRFPEYRFSAEEFNALQATKYDKERGNKVRKFYEADTF